MRLHRLTGGLLLCIGARAALAQSLARATDGSVDLGTAILRQPDLAGSSVITLGSQLRYSARRGSLAASGIAARTPEDRFTGQGIATAALYAPAPQRFRWELAASATGFGVSDAPTTVGWQILAREHLSLGAGGLFAGAGVSETSREEWRWPGFVAHVGGFLRLDPLGADELSGALSFTRTNADRLPDSEWEELGEPFGIVSYGDGVAFWNHDRGRVQVLVGGGARFGIRQADGVKPWAMMSATVWLTPRLGLTGAAGRALADVLRGVPTVRYASVSLRIGFRDHGGPTLLKSTRATADDDAGPRVDVRRGESELRVISVLAATAASVEIMADFTDWEPVALTRDGARGAWMLTRPLAAGSHRISIRIDGGEWVVPPNLPRVTDEFGGTVGLLIVP